MLKQSKKYLALLLVLAICISLFPGDIFAAPDGNNVVINQAYGGGGNSGATYKNDFIELYNPTDNDISLAGWSVQYASATGAFNTGNSTQLSGTIKARGYYLIQEAAGTGGSTSLPAPDASGNINMSGTAFKVALVNGTTAITGKGDPHVVDFVGTGTTANEYEGSAAAAPSNTNSIIRTPDGKDTDNNSADFKTSVPNPRNSSAAGPIATKVATPTASVPSGPVSSGSQISLACTTSGAAIYFTDDGNEPTAYEGGTGIKYTGPISVTSDVTIKAIAGDESGALEDSDVATFIYTTKVPVPSAGIPTGTNVPAGTKVIFTCPVSDAVISYSTDGSTWTDVLPGGLEITGDVGSTVTIYVKASKGNMTDSDTLTLAYTIKEASNIPDPIPDAGLPAGAQNISDVLSSPATTVTVVGQLAYRYGDYDGTSTAILQDVVNGDIVALQVYNALATFSIGDVVKITGTKGSYNGVTQISGVTASELVTAAAEAVKIPPQEFETVAGMLAVKDSLLSEVVLLKDVTLGTYVSNGSTDVTDKNNGSFPIYRAATYPEGVTAGEKVDLLAILSKYNTTDQLRVGTPASNGGYMVYSVANDTKPPVITLPVNFLNASVGTAYTIAVDVKDNKGVGSVTISYTIGTLTQNDIPMSKNATTGKYEYTIPGDQITAENSNFSFMVKAADVTGLVATSPSTEIIIENLPRIISVIPANGSATGADKRPEISVTFENAADPVASLTLKNQSGVEVLKDEAMTIAGGKAGYKPASDLADGKYTASVTVSRKADQAKAERTWSFNVGESSLKPYFGQLHSHTAEYSDGSGTLQNGLDYIKNISKEDNVQFVSFTDHSNYFDTTATANPEAALGDISKATPESRAKWETYTNTMRTFNGQNNGVLAVPGFEMTWSGGPGHINTFNTQGIVSRNNTTLNNKTGNAGMRAYYELLKENPESISQFNHPGTTFGTFADFAYLDPEIDERISMIEVGNGEGAIGSSGYFPSYEYYIQALDKGWHLAPTNNQDNHKGNWGNSNNARSVIITDDFSEKGLLKGMNGMSMYSTEDKNLDIMFTVNDQIMGSVIKEVPGSLHIEASINDPDDSRIGTVEIVVNGGRVIEQKIFNSNSAVLDFNLAPEYSYYFLRVIQPDKDIAVTAPVWVGEVPKVGITGTTTSTVMPVKGEKMTFNTSLYNYENSALKIDNIEYSITHLGATSVIKTVTGLADIPAKTDASIYSLEYTPDKLGFVTLTVKVSAKLGDTPFNFESKKEFEVLDPGDVVPIAIDGGHSNFYVTGNYPDSDAGFVEMCNRSGVRVVRLGKGELTYDNLRDKKLLVLTVPFVSFGTAVTPFLYTDAEIAAIKQYADNGGNIIVCSKSDRGDPTGAGEQADVISNKILEAIGAKAHVEAGIVVDPKKASNESYRITLGGDTADDQKVFNYDGMSTDELAAAFLKDVKEETNNTFSAYNSAPIIPNGATPLVKGFPDTTWSTKYADLLGSAQKYTPKEGAAVITPEGQTYLMTAETLPGGGFAIVSGVTFFSTFEVKVELDNATQKQNSNYQLVQNIIDKIKPAPAIASIADVHGAQEGVKFVIEGIATSNASGYDRDTAFFDCIYVQDTTGGINVFPVSGNIKAGQKVRVTGYTSSYLGERQLEASNVEVIDSNVQPLPEPKKISTKEAGEGAYMGSLVKVEGTVSKIINSNNVVETIMVRDSSGVEARVFIDGYITSNKTINNLAVGAKITATGMSSHDTLGNRIRIRDRADIVCTAQPPTGGGSGTSGNGNSPVNPPAEFDITESGTVKYAPEAPVKDGTVDVVISQKDATALVNTAVQNRSSQIVIAPRPTEEAGRISVTLPRSSLASAAEQGGMALTVDAASIASVRLSNNALKAINNTEGDNVTISVERTANGSIHTNIAVDERQLTGITGQVIAEVPVANATSGTVIVLVNKDGSEKILPKSVLTGRGVAALLDGSATIKLMDNSKTFGDVPPTSDTAGSIAFVTSRRLFNGTGAGRFSPEGHMTRSMMVTVLHNLESQPGTSGSIPFIDVKSGAWYSNLLAWAVEKKIVSGTGNNAYEPDREITRAEFARMLYNYALAMGIDTGNTGDISSFSDSGNIPAWASGAIGWAVEANLFAPGSNGEIAPNSRVSRAEAADALMHLVELIVQ